MCVYIIINVVIIICSIVIFCCPELLVYSNAKIQISQQALERPKTILPFFLYFFFFLSGGGGSEREMRREGTLLL